MQNGHLSALENKHAKLESQIAYEANRPSPDDVRLHALKKQKLAVKDELSSAQSHSVQAHSVQAHSVQAN
ncbi:YdcH family protein [Novosphingopyxis sp.]|uniref:YdcH family protein n=1 Tax=Novosphingopyxis sp. TaxID=2709690 RepID=UPI003B5AF130